MPELLHQLIEGMFKSHLVTWSKSTWLQHMAKQGHYTIFKKLAVGKPNFIFITSGSGSAKCYETLSWILICNSQHPPTLTLGLTTPSFPPDKPPIASITFLFLANTPYWVLRTPSEDSSQSFSKKCTQQLSKKPWVMWRAASFLMGQKLLTMKVSK